MAIISTNTKLYLSLVMDNLSFTILIVILYPYVTGLGGSELYLGFMMSLMSLIGLIWNPMIGSLGDTYGRKVILIRMCAVSAISNFLLLISNSLVLIFVARIISAFGGPLMPILGTAASEYLSKEEQSSYFGKLPAIMSIGFIVGSLLAGFVSEFENGMTFCFLIMMTFNLMNVGNFCLRGHLLRMGLSDTECRFNGEGEETPIHLVTECFAIASLRKEWLGRETCRTEELASLKTSQILDFIRSLELEDELLKV